MADDDQDLQLTAEGTWEPYVVFNSDVKGVKGVKGVEEGLEAKDWRPRTGGQGLEAKDWRPRTGGQGLEAKDWEPFLSVGSGEDVGVEINLYQRRTGKGHPEFLLSVWGEQSGSPFVKVSTLPEAMQLLSQWAPIVQAASIARVVSDLSGGVIEHEGLVETIAARVAWGEQERLPKMKNDRERLDRDAAERHRAARAARNS